MNMLTRGIVLLATLVATSLFAAVAPMSGCSPSAPQTTNPTPNPTTISSTSVCSTINDVHGHLDGPTGRLLVDGDRTTGVDDLDALIEYIDTHSPITPPEDQRIYTTDAP